MIEVRGGNVAHARLAHSGWWDEHCTSLPSQLLRPQ
jgi:hypothetical protein